MWFVLTRALIALAVLFIPLVFGTRALERAILFHPVALDRGVRAPAGAQEEWIAGAGGSRLHAWRFRKKANPRAVIVFNHGNGGNLSSVKALGDDMARRGYEVLLWDYRGYGRSEGALPSDEETLFADARLCSIAPAKQAGPWWCGANRWGPRSAPTFARAVLARRSCSNPA